jgi:hypothetical protein
MVHLILRRHPHEVAVDHLEREYIRSPCQMKVLHLKKFLSMKLGDTLSPVRLEVIIIASNTGIVLNEKLSLRDICRHFWDGRSDLVLHYRKV